MTDDDALYMWTVYDHPRDMPDKFVARCWRITRGQDPQATAVFYAHAELEPLRKFLRAKYLTQLERSEYDDPVIVETWL
jgi:hypothetical protein